MNQYCGKSQANQEFKVANSNYGLLNFVLDEESLDERTYQGSSNCSWHYTDTMECLLIGMALAFILRLLYRKFKVYRAKKKKEKLNGILVICQQALDNRSLSLSPTAPIQALTNVPRVSPYQGIRSDVWKKHIHLRNKSK